MAPELLLRPAPYTGISSRDAHLRRNPPSREPGVDYYMPTGTPLAAPADCVVVENGGSIHPATGRYTTLEVGHRWIRYLHLKEWWRKPGDRLERGEGFGASGASGYGSEFFGEPSRNAAFWRNTGGDHVHVTAFKGRGYTLGASGTDDFHAISEDFDDMGKIDNTEENYQTIASFLQRAFRFDVRPLGKGPDHRLGPTVFELLGAADDSADVKAMAVKMTPEDRAEIAKAVAGAIQLPSTGGATKADIAAAIDAGLAKLVLKPASS